MGNNDEKSVSPEDRELFRRIAQDIKTNPVEYRQAGKWLDEYCSEEAYWQRQENELEKLRAQEKEFPTLPIVQRVRRLEEEIRMKRTPALLVRFQEARDYLFEKYKQEQFIPEDDAKRIILITWLLTDPDAEKADLGITEREKWTWEPIDDITKMSRGYAQFLWREGGRVYDRWMDLLRIACLKLGAQKQDELAPASSGQIFGETWTLAGIPIHFRNLLPRLKKLKLWQKLIWYPILGLVMLSIVVFSTRWLWGPIITRIGSDSHAADDEQLIGKVASHVRPYVIFDAGGAIHVDGGAMQYLEKIEVEEVGTVMKEGEHESHVDELKIIVTPKSHLTYGPLVEALGELRSIIIYDPKRGAGHQWIYQALIRPPYGGDIKTQKFRLEVLR